MAFAGCSFTWGQGLWYYSALDDLPPDPHYGYDERATNALHHTFREKWRWPTLVADHFGTVGITHYRNGGANDQIVKWWTKSFTSQNVEPVRSFHWKDGKIDDSCPVNPSNVSNFVFQFTNWARSSIQFPVDGKEETIDVQTTWDPTSRYHRSFLEWLDSQEIDWPSKRTTKVGEFHQIIMRRDVAQVKGLLTQLEFKGVKTHIMCWPPEHLSIINDDPWLMERFINFDYNGKTYNCIADLIDKEDGMSLEKDFEFFDVPPKDGHPSLKCQRVIADSVIRAIEKRNVNG